MAPPRNGIQYSRGTRNILVSPPEIEITLPPPPSSPPLRSPTSFYLAHDRFDKASSRRNEDVVVVERVLNNFLLKLTSTRRSVVSNQIGTIGKVQVIWRLSSLPLIYFIFRTINFVFFFFYFFEKRMIKGIQFWLFDNTLRKIKILTIGVCAFRWKRFLSVEKKLFLALRWRSSGSLLKTKNIRVKDWPYPPTHCPIYACVLEKSHWSLKYRVLDLVATRVFTVVIVEENFETGRKEMLSLTRVKIMRWQNETSFRLNACDVLA